MPWIRTVTLDGMDSDSHIAWYEYGRLHCTAWIRTVTTHGMDTDGHNTSRGYGRLQATRGMDTDGHIASHGSNARHPCSPLGNHPRAFTYQELLGVHDAPTWETRLIHE